MAVYYNEIDPFCAAWLRELITAGELPDGEIDTRSIRDVRADDLRGFEQCHFFAGIGGWPYALRLARWGDAPVWTGSCPCQPFSAAGKGAGADDSRDLWPTWFHLISECRPVVLFGEQVASADGLGWLDRVSADLEGSDYAIGAADVCAAGVGAFHIRQRIWFVAHTARKRRTWLGVLLRAEEGERGEGEVLEAPRRGETGDVADADGGRQQQRHADIGTVSEPHANGWTLADWLPCSDGKSRPVEPGTFPLAHGLPARVGRLRGYGNAIVPAVAQVFIESYLDCQAQGLFLSEDAR